ncbi:MAG: hypothetical protein U0T84_06580 [Chitinophagales bacterium]
MLKWWMTALLGWPLWVAAQTDSAVIYRQLLQSEKAEIRQFSPLLQNDFFTLVDSLAAQRPAPNDMRRLLQFLHQVNDESLLKNNTYTDVLRYVRLIRVWQEQGNLAANIRSYPSLSLKAFVFFSEDTTASSFLEEQVNVNPQEVLRQADFLVAEKDGRKAIELAMIKAPEYAKRYFALEGAVADVLDRSRRPEVRMLSRIYSRFGVRTRAYLLLHPLMTQRFSIEHADSITRNAEELWKELGAVMLTEHPIGVWSVDNELKYLSVERIRKWNELPQVALDAQWPTATSDQLLLAALAFRDGSPRVMDALIRSIKMKQDEIHANLIQNIQPARLSSLIQYLQQNGTLPDVLYRVENTARNGLLNLLAFDEKSEQRPVFPTIAAVTSPAEEKPLPVEESRTEDESVISEPVAPFVPQLPDSEKVFLSYTKNLFATLQRIPSFIDLPQAKRILLYAAQYEPDELLKKTEAFKSKFWCREVVERAALNAPVTAKRYLADPNHPVSAILYYSQRKEIIQLQEWSKAMGFASKPMLLFDAMVRGVYSLPEAMVVAENNVRFFRSLIQIASQKKYFGAYNVDRELNYQALRLVRVINDKVNLPFEQRFGNVDTNCAQTLYYIMVFGREEVFSATFNGLFSRFKSRARVDADFLSSVTQLPHFKSFFSLCNNYGKAEELLSIFNGQQQQALMASLGLIDDSIADPIGEAAVIAEIIANSNSDYVIKELQQQIKRQYEAAEQSGNQESEVLFGVLAAAARDKAVIDKHWYQQVAQKFKSSSLSMLHPAQLRDGNLTVERQYFYNDDDGRASYDHFLNTFRNREGWKVEEGYNFAKVSSTSGQSVLIYSNKPTLEESGDEAINKIFKENNYQPTVIIHRGHSFHTAKTLTRVPDVARLVVVGSCGGFYQLNLALRNAPEAQFISTRQVGVAPVNDPIIFALNEYLRQNKDIRWKLFWEEMRQKVGSNPMFADYVPPHKNLESIFVRTYYKLLGV